MALPTIVINSGTGSDTLASGAGPGTAITGTLAATHANTTVNITDAVALGGVAVDGSAVLWVSSSSGKQWAKITAISGSSGAWVVTVADAYANTESGRSWAIGGKRATISGSLQLGIDCRGGWTIDLQTGDTLVANFNLAPNAVAGVWTTFTSTSVTRPTITTSTNSVCGVDVKGASNLVISHLHLTSTAGTPGVGIGLSTFGVSATFVVVSDCVIEGFNRGIIDHDAGGNTDIFSMVVDGCEVKNCISHGLELWAGAQVAGVYSHNNGGSGLFCNGSRTRGTSVVHSIFDSNTGNQADITVPSQTAVLIRNCNFTNAPTAKKGLLVNTSSNTTSVDISNSIIYGNITTGLDISGGGSAAIVLRNNAFGGNGANTAVGSFIGTGSSPITLTANPFVSSTDFALNSTSGGGPLCRAAGTAWIGSATATAPDVGAIQQGSGASVSSGGPVIGCGFIRGIGTAA